jgi:hypothetical protein
MFSAPANPVYSTFRMYLESSFLTTSIAAILVLVTVSSWLDYCSQLLTASTTDPAILNVRPNGPSECHQVMLLLKILQLLHQSLRIRLKSL